jgi:hypothetical protein
MGIELATSKGKSEINGENFAESMQRLENMLEPGTPVMFQKYRSNNLSMGGGRHAQRLLFFSGGKLSREGVFNLQKGKRNFSYVTINEKDSTSYQVVHHWQEALDNHRLSVPKSWTMRQYNEGTFSPAGPSEWNSFHSAGTEEIVVGDILTEKFPDAMHALRFGRDAVYFDLHSFYSMQSYLVTEIGDKGIRGEQESQRETQTHRIACLRACMNLINEAEREIGEYHNSVIAKHVGWFRDGTQRLRDGGHPVDDRDYLVQELSHPSRSVAFVKTGKGIKYGETYILPFSEKMDNIVELAFSEDMVRKHYPHGFKD